MLICGGRDLCSILYPSFKCSNLISEEMLRIFSFFAVILMFWLGCIIAMQ